MARTVQWIRWARIVGVLDRTEVTLLWSLSYIFGVHSSIMLGNLVGERKSDLYPN